jgi:molybdenum cofactor cytidylyltransferase
MATHDKTSIPVCLPSSIRAMSDLIPILLAAGASSRMGRPKALLDFDGRSTLQLALDAVRGHGTPIVVLGPNHFDIREKVPLGQVRVMLNLNPDTGQTASLQAALSILPKDAEGFFFMPVDYPLVTAADVARLVEAYRAEPDPAKKIFVPSHDMKRGHPILCRRELAAEFLALREGASARDVVNRVNSRLAYVIYPEAYVLMDMDTPEDYRRCLEAYRARQRSQ